MNDQIAWGGLLLAVLAGAIRSGTPIAFAAIGETLSERSGVMNLGVEGMMLMGAMVGVVVQVKTGIPALALLAAGLAASTLAAVHAFITIYLNGNQLVSGIGLSIVGTGLSGFLGRPYVGVRFSGIDNWGIPFLKDLPVLGKVLFQHDILVYLTVFVAAAVWFLLYKTRFGLQVRAVGEEPNAAYAQGVPVQRSRTLAVILGGFLAGIGGAHLSLAYTQLWAERMTAGQGLIAIGLVIVAGWHPLRVLLTTYLFGMLIVLHLNLQASGITISPYILAALPYIFAVLALTFVTFIDKRRGMPAALAKEFNMLQ
ncbi:MAG: ABC transporter permease [Candidatus Poribacteria bacterium]|nr:ABC transporter permease [Candidatus Poribacteria bacterium]